MKRLVSLVINGRQREDAVADNLLLLDYLREIAGLTGTKRG
jgi:4-hydroxybenzoyl-CoA reductase subunit gamma